MLEPGTDPDESKETGDSEENASQEEDTENAFSSQVQDEGAVVSEECNRDSMIEEIDAVEGSHQKSDDEGKLVAEFLPIDTCSNTEETSANEKKNAVILEKIPNQEIEVEKDSDASGSIHEDSAGEVNDVKDLALASSENCIENDSVLQDLPSKESTNNEETGCDKSDNELAERSDVYCPEDDKMNIVSKSVSPVHREGESIDLGDCKNMDEKDNSVLDMFHADANTPSEICLNVGENNKGIEEIVEFSEKYPNFLGKPTNSKTLPQCRLKRNYSCLHCGFSTQNPREHLYHLRDEHGERMRVFECPRCIYASKNHQKLIRHARMVHKLKIRQKDCSDGLSKKHSKSPKAKVSSLKSPRCSVSPGKSSRSSSGKSPKSCDGSEDMWDAEEEDEEFGKRKSLPARMVIKRCITVNSVIITPYRWNLDRHMKNHTEDCGEYKCHMCNFTAQIKQSLTVHISNHHLTPEQIRERELRRTIGISDPADCTSDDQEMEMLRLERDEHPDALRLPGFDDPDSPMSTESHHNGNSFRVSNIDMGGNEDSHINAEGDDGEPRRKKPKIKITLKKMKEPKVKDTFFQELNERHNFEEDFIHPDDVVHRHGNVYIKTFKCHYCSFKAAFKNEVSRHEKKVHSIHGPKSEICSKKTKKLLKTSRTAKEHSDSYQQVVEHPQPLRGSATDTVGKSKNEAANCGLTLDFKERGKDKGSCKDLGQDQVGLSQKPNYESQAPHSKEPSPSKDAGKKKNASFLEKLQEKISTSNVQNLVCQFCGHESKCLSESVRHQKLHLSAKNIYASASLSTRCQFCRHRCKTTDDLVNHLKLCPEARKNQIMDSGRKLSTGRQDGGDDDDDDEENEFDDDCNNSYQDGYMEDTNLENTDSQ
ncbi:hypothetical protein SK128_013478 [Halocaridina rubra]|uniref:C2H2-type domain-containing protein n=1 Tax=Halocaridina rubra TaxID=373956 RepID=A0AAN8WQI7_HALRR